MKSKYVILPSNSDLNRGDQALVWETLSVSKAAGNKGTHYMLKSGDEPTIQSEAEGIKTLTPILQHPSRKFKSKKNNDYNTKLIIKWGSVALIDLLGSILLLSKITRFFVSPFLSKDKKQTINIIKESDKCFIKGGGFIHSSGKLTDSYVVYYQLFHIMLAHSFGKEVYVMPNSFGPFKGIGVSWLVRRTLNRCKFISVRESVSLEMLNDIGVKGELFPDLGFSLKKEEIEDDELQRILNDHPDRKTVAITARPYRFSGSTEPKVKYKKYIDSMVEFSKWLYENNYLPVFVEHTLSETTHESDGAAINEISSKLINGQYGLISSEEYNCRDLKYIYDQFNYVVGTRFHSVIFSMSERTPSIAIEYGGNKGKGIMKDMGLSELGIPIEEVSYHELKKSFQYLIKNETEVITKINSYMKLVDQKRNEMIEFLKKN